MDEQPKPNLRDFLNEVSSFSGEDGAEAPAAQPKAPAAKLAAIGQVVEIAGSGSQIRLDAATVAAFQSHSDPSVAMSGQVGSQIKTVVGNAWLIANVRTLQGRRPRRAHRPCRLPWRRHARFDWPDEQLPPRRHALPDPGQ